MGRHNFWFYSDSSHTECNFKQKVKWCLTVAQFAEPIKDISEAVVHRRQRLQLNLLEVFRTLVLQMTVSFADAAHDGWRLERNSSKLKFQDAVTIMQYLQSNIVTKHFCGAISHNLKIKSGALHSLPTTEANIWTIALCVNKPIKILPSDMTNAIKVKNLEIIFFFLFSPLVQSHIE